MRKSDLSSAIKTARDIMRKDAGLSTDVDRIPQLSWILFLKCFDDLEQRRLLLQGKYRDVIEAPHRWRDWAADEDRGRTGDDGYFFTSRQLRVETNGRRRTVTCLVRTCREGTGSTARDTPRSDRHQGLHD